MKIVEKNAASSSKWVFFTALVFCSYLLLIAFSPHKLLYDEGYYISIAKNLASHGLTFKFISTMNAPTGILYSLVHWLASPFTQYQPPWIRVVNFILGCGSGFLLSKIYAKIHSNSFGTTDHSSYLALAAVWLATPVTGVILCLALTEMSGIFFSLLGTLFITYAILDSKKDNIPIIYLILGGISYGLSIWGRQNLIILPAFSILLFLPLTWSSFRSYFIIIATSLPFFIVPIIIWGGLVPPAVDFVGKGILPSSLAFSFYYISASIGLTCPGIYLHLNKKNFLLSLMLSASTIALFPTLILVPSRFLVQRLAGDAGAYLIGICFSTALLTLSIVTVIILIAIVKQQPREVFAIFFLVSAFAILASNVKISHQFSSRYVTIALPYMLLAIFLRDNNQARLNLISILLLTLSLFASLFFVINYYQT